MSSSSVDLGLAGLNAAASLLSVAGTSFILFCYCVLPHKQHIRHAMIVNLTLADFINSLNNSVSGLWVVANREDLRDGSGCIANGFIGQVSVQAVDCCILAITLVTLWIIKAQRVTSDISLTRIVIICGAPWVLPIITGTIALAEGWYHPASENWCWIQDSPTYLRYVLTHGWRFLIIFIVTAICIYIQIYLRRHLRATAAVNGGPYIQQLDSQSVPSVDRVAVSKFRKPSNGGSSNNEEDEEKLVGYELQRGLCHDFKGPLASSAAIKVPSTQQHVPKIPAQRKPSMFTKKSSSSSSSQAKGKASVEKTMLLNAYPIFYIILWLPGIANRIAEATGHEIYALAILQSATQLIGFANAVTFGWNERIGRHLKARFMAKVGGADQTRWTID